MPAVDGKAAVGPPAECGWLLYIPMANPAPASSAQQATTHSARPTKRTAEEGN
jgi:hypothetical protein